MDCITHNCLISHWQITLETTLFYMDVIGPAKFLKHSQSTQQHIADHSTLTICAQHRNPKPKRRKHPHHVGTACCSGSQHLVTSCDDMSLRHISAVNRQAPCTYVRDSLSPSHSHCILCMPTLSSVLKTCWYTGAQTAWLPAATSVKGSSTLIAGASLSTTAESEAFSDAIGHS